MVIADKSLTGRQHHPHLFYNKNLDYNSSPHRTTVTVISPETASIAISIVVVGSLCWKNGSRESSESFIDKSRQYKHNTKLNISHCLGRWIWPRFPQILMVKNPIPHAGIGTCTHTSASRYIHWHLGYGLQQCWRGCFYPFLVPCQFSYCLC